MTVSGRALVIPMWNEAERIDATISAIASSALGASDLTLILADDGSTDESRSVADAALKRVGQRGEVLALPHTGKGGAVRAGVLHADAPWIAFTDADLSAPPDDIEKVFAALEAGRGQVVAGTRVSDLGAPAPPMRKAARVVMRRVVRTLKLTSVPDTQCGLKGFSREVGRAILEPLQTDGFAFDVELLARAEHLGVTVHTQPVGWRHGEGSTVRVLRDAPAMVGQMLGMLWRRRNWPREI